MPQQTSARPVAGGELRVSSADGPSSSPPVLYEVWAAPASETTPADAWVELHMNPDEPPLRLEASTLSMLKSRVDAHTAPETLREATVGVGGGSLSMSLRQEWPLGASVVVLLCFTALFAAVVVAVRSQRRASAFQIIARHEAASREAERMRVAREIHDGPLQDVTSLVRAHAQVSEASGPAAGVDRVVQEPLAHALRRVSADLRALATGLRPPALDEFGLEPALEDLADRWARMTEPLTVRLLVRYGPEGAGPRPSTDVELAVYRITQESLANAAAHGGAATAWIFLTDQDGVLDLIVRDNGRGISESVRIDRSHTQRLISGGHFGLAGMVERAQSVGGTLEVGSGPGGLGTEVHLSVPSGRPSAT